MLSHTTTRTTGISADAVSDIGPSLSEGIELTPLTLTPLGSQLGSGAQLGSAGSLEKLDQVQVGLNVHGIGLAKEATPPRNEDIAFDTIMNNNIALTFFIGIVLTNSFSRMIFS